MMGAGVVLQAGRVADEDGPQSDYPLLLKPQALV
jgi:hypothetical protein